MQIKRGSVIYVNFSQYDNTGRILDFLKENFPIVVQFSFDHLRLKNGRKTNYLKIYENRELTEKRKLLNFKTPSILLFPSLPLVGLLMMVQTTYYSWLLKRKYGRFDYFITVNGFSAWIGLLLKNFTICKRTIFWVWDYFPLTYPDWRIRFARWIYWKFDLASILNSDRIIFTNRRLYNYFKKNVSFSSNRDVHIVPIGTNRDNKIRAPLKVPIIGFLGMIKEHQGIVFCVRNMQSLIKIFPNITFEIIGSGPDEMSLKRKTRKLKKHVKFYGFIEDQNEINKIIKRWHVGLATYLPVSSNESYWGDPSKIKTYFGLGIPVVTTDVSYFTDEIRKNKAGIVIDYDDEQFAKAIKELIKKNKYYSKNAFSLSAKYDYKKLYPKLFEPNVLNCVKPKTRAKISTKIKNGGTVKIMPIAS